MGKALFSGGVGRCGRVGGRGGRRGSGRGSNRIDGSSRTKPSANAGTIQASEGSEGSNNPPASKQISPKPGYDKVKGNKIRCLEPRHTWY